MNDTKRYPTQMHEVLLGKESPPMKIEGERMSAAAGGGRMTREESALVRLRLMAHRAFGAMVENMRGGSEEAQKDFDAIDWAIATIKSKIARPQPDPDTGLVPCGCGGKAVCEPYWTACMPGNKATGSGCIRKSDAQCGRIRRAHVRQEWS